MKNGRGKREKKEEWKSPLGKNDRLMNMVTPLGYIFPNTNTPHSQNSSVFKKQTALQ